MFRMRNYKQTSNQHAWNESTMQQGILSIKSSDQRYKKAAKGYSVPQTTLERRVKILCEKSLND